jgi:hypothetical protein
LDGVVSKLKDKGSVSLVTSPTADKGSIDAITSLSAQRNRVPVKYVTTEGYVKYINPDNFPDELNIEAFAKQPKYVLPTKEAYSEATAKLSNIFIGFEGRDTTVGDMVNAIKAGNKVVIIDNEDHNPDLWDNAKSRPQDASEYVEVKLSGDELLPWLVDKGFTAEFLEKYEREIRENLVVVNVDKSIDTDKAIDLVVSKLA